MHVPEVLELAQAPPQLDTAFPAVGAAVKITAVLLGKVPLQVPALQEMPLGLEVTVPAPVAEIVSLNPDAAVGVATNGSLPLLPQPETTTATIAAASSVNPDQYKF